MIDRAARRVTRNPLMRYLAVALVCALAGGVAGGVAAVTGATGALEVVIKAGSMALAMAVGMFACRWWWSTLDEAAREAHKWAWWWGSTYGLAVAGVGLLSLLIGTGGAGDFTGWSPADLLLAGAGGVVAVQTVGYAIAWAIWWLRRR